MTAKLKFTKEQVLEAYAGKATIQQAARTLGCSFVPLSKLMREYGIPAKPRGFRPGDRCSEIPQLNDREWLYAEIVTKGRTQREVAQELGTTNGNVAHYVRKHNLYPWVSQSQAARMALRRRFPDGRSGPLAANWRGGRRKSGSGYWLIYKPEHPNANPRGYVYEHRDVMEKKIGRLLRPGEVVDHVDCDKGNNDPDNLRLHASRSEHVKDHFRGRREKFEELAALRAKLARYLEKYGPLDDE